MARTSLFVVVAPGLEALAAAELAELGIPTGRIRPRHGGIDVEATTRQLYAMHRWSRIPSRVLVRVGTGTARRWGELQDLVRSVDWTAYVPPGAAVQLHVASHGSVLYHQGAIAERVLAVLDRPDARGGQGVHVRVDRDRVVLSVDASGELLHRRGWRSTAHRAPLRTTLAAAMVRASGWDGATPLVDPMAGSGTIAIEAAAWAAGLPHDRDVAFLHWPSFEPGTWASVRGERRPDRLLAPVIAADRDAGAADACADHVRAAGLDGRVTVQHAPLSAQTWPGEPGTVVVNPPYGHRVGGAGGAGGAGGRDLRDLYAALGRRVRDGGHRLVLLTDDRRLEAATGLDLVEAFRTSNGGIDVRCTIAG